MRYHDHESAEINDEEVCVDSPEMDLNGASARKKNLQTNYSEELSPKKPRGQQNNNHYHAVMETPQFEVPDIDTTMKSSMI